MKSYLEDFLQFIYASPTPYHAAKEAGVRLAEADFVPLEENKTWEMKKGEKYFLIKDQALTCAFILPKKSAKKILISASHLDSPALKLRPDLHSPTEHSQLGVEIYGGPLLNSWLNVDLGIAGRVLYSDKRNKIKTKWIDFRDFPLFIPQLPIHLDREVNDKGLQLNKQDHLKPIFSFSKVDILKVLQKNFSFDNLLSYDLFLFPLEAPRLVGYEQEMIASYRLDNLSSAYAQLAAIIDSEADDDTLKIAIFWDHEEIGSKTHLGADSIFVMDLLHRILGKDEAMQCRERAFAISIDVAHALNPNFPAKFDPQFTPVLGRGIALKYSAAQKYTNSALTTAVMKLLCEKEKVPFQNYVARNDTPSGSTVGPMMAASLGMRSIDIGCSLLSMHSTREVISSKDQYDLYRLLKAAYESSTLFEETNE
ncbi:MAG TPA: M18 family aminopeptidase [Chlamydiales bacterium]|nr:M18 family aminopeptidase [Chlamydiales bacterium]